MHINSMPQVHLNILTSTFPISIIGNILWYPVYENRRRMMSMAQSIKNKHGETFNEIDNAMQGKWKEWIEIATNQTYSDKYKDDHFKILETHLYPYISNYVDINCFPQLWQKRDDILFEVISEVENNRSTIENIVGKIKKKVWYTMLDMNRKLNYYWRKHTPYEESIHSDEDRQSNEAMKKNIKLLGKEIEDLIYNNIDFNGNPLIDQNDSDYHLKRVIIISTILVKTEEALQQHGDRLSLYGTIAEIFSRNMSPQDHLIKFDDYSNCLNHNDPKIRFLLSNELLLLRNHISKVFITVNTDFEKARDNFYHISSRTIQKIRDIILTSASQEYKEKIADSIH
jgi:hypothetical protein